MKQNVLFTAGLLVFSSASAQTNQHATSAETSGQVVVSATRIETPIEQVGSSISVVTEEQIQLQNAQTLQDAIRLVPGIQMSGNGGPGTSSSISIRGAESDHTLVLINGMRANSNTTGGFDFSSFPVDMIESIEVLRGPQSGLYGSDALGGVVNITTKKGADIPFGGTAAVSIGEKGYRNGSASLHGGSKAVDFYTSISALGLENHDIAENNDGTEDDPYRRASVYGGIGLNFATDGRADLTALYVDDKNELDQFGGIDDPLENSRKKKLFTALSASKPIGEKYTQSASAGYSRQEYTGYNGGPTDYNTTSIDAALKGDWTPIANDTLSVGYDFRRTEAENQGNFDSEHRNQHALFIHNKWAWKESLFINLGARYDEYSDIDGKATWKAGASWFALADTRLHGSAGTGYRAPTMNDLYYTFGAPPRYYLEPEQSQSFDIGVEQSALEGKLIGDITYFQSDVEDLIAWAYVGPNPWDYAPMNVDEADIRGVETSLAYSPAESLTTRIFYTYTDAKDANTGNELPRRARHTGGAAINWKYSRKGNIYSDFTYTGKRYDDTGNTTELDAFFLIGLGTRYAVTDSTKLVAHISNLLDENYETANGYAAVGRVISAGVEVVF